MIASLNEVSSQVWAAILILLGMSTFVLACMAGRFFHADTTIEAALISSATGMIGAGIAMFQHQPKDSETTTSIQTTPQPQGK